MHNKLTLSLIGVGAFGRFIIPHLTPHFHVSIYDKFANIDDIDMVTVVDIETAAKADIVILGVPVQVFEDVVLDIKNYIRVGQTVMDITSVKLIPEEILKTHMPDGVNIVGLHPMFGPQSGKNGIQGLNVAAIDVRGDQYDFICAFLSDILQLNVIRCTSDDHDLDMAYVQGLTHIIAKSFSGMNIPELMNTTKTYDLLSEMVDLIKNDSDELFQAIQSYNPHAKDVRTRFLKRVMDIDKKLSEN